MFIIVIFFFCRLPACLPPSSDKQFTVSCSCNLCTFFFHLFLFYYPLIDWLLPWKIFCCYFLLVIWRYYLAWLLLSVVEEKRCKIIIYSEATWLLFIFCHFMRSLLFDLYHLVIREIRRGFSRGNWRKVEKWHDKWKINGKTIDFLINVFRLYFFFLMKKMKNEICYYFICDFFFKLNFFNSFNENSFGIFWKQFLRFLF